MDNWLIQVKYEAWKESFLLYLYLYRFEQLNFPGNQTGFWHKLLSKWRFVGWLWNFEGFWGHQLLYGGLRRWRFQFFFFLGKRWRFHLIPRFSEYFWLLIVNWRTKILLCFGGFFPICYYLQANSNNDVAFRVVLLLL